MSFLLLILLHALGSGRLNEYSDMKQGLCSNSQAVETVVGLSLTPSRHSFCCCLPSLLLSSLSLLHTPTTTASASHTTLTFGCF